MKKFKYLYTDGCSHTAGGGMEKWKMDIINCYKEKYNIDIKNHRDCAWPKLLATKLNLKSPYFLPKLKILNLFIR